MSDKVIPRDAYKLRAVYDAEILPLIDKIRDICDRDKLPFIFCFQTAQSEDGNQTLTATCGLHGMSRASPQMLALRLLLDNLDNVLTPLAARMLMQFGYGVTVTEQSEKDSRDIADDNVLSALSAQLREARRKQPSEDEDKDEHEKE